MPRYQGQLLAVVSTAFKSAGFLYASSGTRARRMAVFEATLGQTGGLSSTDCQMQYDFSRFTTTSLIAGTAFTPSPVDPADDASLAIYLNTITTEVAALAAAGAGLNLFSEAQNQRATFRWRALETYDNMMIPAVNLSGLAIRVLSSNFNASAVGQISYIE